MTIWGSRLYAICVLLAFGLAACTSSPTTSPTGSVTVTTAGLLAPANGQQIANLAQPVTLTITNALVTNGGVAVTYTFEVATDTLFANKVVTKDVPQTTGQTSLKLDPLTAGQDYYWHVRTTGGDTVGVFTSPLKFTIGPAIVIQPPVPISPPDGTATGGWPTFTVTDASKVGPTGALLYRFDISTTADFTTTTIVGTVPETPNQTSFTPPQGQPTPSQTTSYFWRVTVTDTIHMISSLASPTRTFVLTGLWSGVQPPGTNGHAILGDNWQTQVLVSHSGVRFTSPTLEQRQIFDLLDRGFDPQGAIDWMQSHGYASSAAWFPVSRSIGFEFEYMALIGGRWDLILRAE